MLRIQITRPAAGRPPKKLTCAEVGINVDELQQTNHISLSRMAANGAPRHPNAAAALGAPPRRARRRGP